MIALSVIVPFFGTREADLTWLAECLGPVVRGELRDQSEIIVVDDHSPIDPGATRAVAEAAGGRVLRLMANAGPGVARNAGAREAAGRILVFIDHDCVPYPEWLRDITEPIRRGACGATTSCYSGPIPETRLTIFQDEDYRHRMPQAAVSTDFVNSPNFAIDRALFEDVGGFAAQRVSEDMVIGMRLNALGRPVRFLPRCGIQHRYHTALRPYLGQRHRFALNTALSFARRGKPTRPQGPSTARRSFSLARVGLGMASAVSLIAAALSAMLGALADPVLTWAVWALLAAAVAMFSAAHGAFLVAIASRRGASAALHAVGVLHLTDAVHLLAVARAGVMMASWRWSATPASV